MMTQQQEALLLIGIRAAVLEAIEAVGIEGVREMSMFPSSKWNKTNDNQIETPLAKAA